MHRHVLIRYNTDDLCLKPLPFQVSDVQSVVEPDGRAPPPLFQESVGAGLDPLVELVGPACEVHPDRVAPFLNREGGNDLQPRSRRYTTCPHCLDSQRVRPSRNQRFDSFFLPLLLPDSSKSYLPPKTKNQANILLPRNSREATESYQQLRVHSPRTDCTQCVPWVPHRLRYCPPSDLETHHPSFRLPSENYF